MRAFHSIRRPAGLAAGTLLVAIALYMPSAASAATVTGSLPVSGTVSAVCTITTTPVAFGATDVLSGANDDATGGITVTCTNATPWAASAGVGAGAGASFTNRKLTSGANLMNYNLYTSAAYTTVWGDGTAPTATLPGTGTGGAQAVTIYGRIPLGQTTVPTGSYADTVTVTVTY